MLNLTQLEIVGAGRGHLLIPFSKTLIPLPSFSTFLITAARRSCQNISDKSCCVIMSLVFVTSLVDRALI